MSDISALLKKIDHRPFPLPGKRWVIQQSWSKLLFAHWPINAEYLRTRIPNMLDIDTFENSAWIGVVPFAMHKVRPRYAVEAPWLSDFLELNLRTYVIKDGIPGVYFFSLDCSNPLAVLIARKFFHLPYFNATMKLSTQGGVASYYSRRNDSAVVFESCYKPQGEVFKSSPGSIEQFLTERYCLYTTDKPGNCYRAVIHHDMWNLQLAEAEIRVNELAYRELGINLDRSKPLLHYSENIDTVEWPLELLN